MAAATSRAPKPVSPQTQALNDLYFTEHANGMYRRVRADGCIRVALFREGVEKATCVAFITPDGQVRQEATA